jgi:hypothetical protein
MQLRADALAYRVYCDGKQLSDSAKQDVYRVVLFRSMTFEQDALERVELSELSREDAAEVMKRF